LTRLACVPSCLDNAPRADSLPATRSGTQSSAPVRVLDELGRPDDGRRLARLLRAHGPCASGSSCGTSSPDGGGEVGGGFSATSVARTSLRRGRGSLMTGAAGEHGNEAHANGNAVSSLTQSCLVHPISVTYSPKGLPSRYSSRFDRYGLVDSAGSSRATPSAGELALRAHEDEQHPSRQAREIPAIRPR
jgi:hypothetical protein